MDLSSTAASPSSLLPGGMGGLQFPPPHTCCTSVTLRGDSSPARSPPAALSTVIRMWWGGGGARGYAKGLRVSLEVLVPAERPASSLPPPSGWPPHARSHLLPVKSNRAQYPQCPLRFQAPEIKTAQPRYVNRASHPAGDPNPGNSPAPMWSADTAWRWGRGSGVAGTQLSTIGRAVSPHLTTSRGPRGAMNHCHPPPETQSLPASPRDKSQGPYFSEQKGPDLQAHTLDKVPRHP